MPFSHVRAWQPAAARRWPTDEREAKERRKRGEREESRRNVLYLRHKAAYSPWNKDGRRFEDAGRTPEGRRKNAKTRGALKLLRKFLPRFRIPEASWTTKNARKNSPAKVASRNTRNINISQTYARNCDYDEIRASQSQLERG